MVRSMRYGVALGAAGESRDPRRMADLAALAERSGWDGMFLEDYLVYQGERGMPTFDPWICLAAMATATTRIRLGTTVTPLPRRRPWKLASEAVALDHLSGGRLILGVGLGDVSDPAFSAVGERTAPRIRAELLDEGLEILDRLWSGRPVTYAGRHFQVRGLRLSPTPVQQPRIPIWIGGDLRFAGVRRRLARWDGCCVHHVGGPDDVREILQLVEHERGSSAGFDVRVSLDGDAGFLRSLARAGATWLNSWIPPGDWESTQKLIGRGPRRVD
jgi:alkanesulfonate monooxygenase SsuD/methylene tetrahydromethanopterin reductase-like flavin-dependent oxidoreductase (luciferase family)